MDSVNKYKVGVEMDCGRCAELMDGALEGTLDTERYEAFNRHIASCAECRARFEASLTIRNAATGLMADPPEQLLANVMYHVENGKKPRHFIFGRFTVIAAAAALLLFVIYQGGLKIGIFESAPAPADAGTGSVYADNNLPAGGGSVSDAENEPYALKPSLNGALTAADQAAPVPSTAPVPSAAPESSAARQSGADVTADAPEKQDALPRYGLDRIIAPSHSSDLTGMNLYWSTDIEPDQTLSLYTAAQYDNETGFAWDDGQDWALIFENNAGVFPLFPRQYVQLGGVSCSAYYEWDVEPAVLHVLVEVRQTAGYTIYDCVYDGPRGEFNVDTVYDADEINFMGSSETAR
jgi:hypothetical protein